MDNTCTDLDQFMAGLRKRNPGQENIKKWDIFFSNQAAIFNIDAGLSAFFSIFNPGYQRSK